MLTRQLVGLWEGILSYLHPHHVHCIACNRPAAANSRIPGLCSPCTTYIPWIRQPVCRVCGRSIDCPDCRRSTFAGRQFTYNRSAVEYDTEMRSWLASYKYNGNEGYSAVIGGILKEGYYRMQQEMSSFYRELWSPDIITWVPASPDRLVSRGFDQARVMADELSGAIQVPSIPLLMRNRHTVKQSTQSRRGRIQNVEGVFSYQSHTADWLLHIAQTKKNRPSKNYVPFSKKIDNRDTCIRILLIDDIYTTGSTINSCAEALQQAAAQCNIKAEVFSLTWARS